MTDIKLLMDRVEELERRVHDLESQLEMHKSMNSKIATHPMETRRESISRSSPAEQSKHMQILKEQLRLKKSS